MTSTLIPAAADGAAPPIAAYHPTTINPDNCLARRYSSDTKDRRWSPMVYAAFQCKKKPVSGSDLCERCGRHERKYTDAVAAGAAVAVLRDIDWSGRVGDMASIPAHSHIAGSQWHLDRCVWTGAPKPKTAKQEGRLDKRPLVKDVELEHFADGTIDLDIERLSALNQITGAQLLAVINRMVAPPTPIKAAGTKKEMCARIRRLHAARTHAAGGAAAATAPVLEVHEEPAAKPKKRTTTAKFELRLIGETVYAVRNGNVYEFNELEEKAGEFVGRLTADGEDIDPEAEEELQAKKPKSLGRKELRAAIWERDAELAALRAELAAATQKLAAVTAALGIL